VGGYQYGPVVPDHVLNTPPDRPGGPAARNIGLAALTTDYVFYLDADDMVLPHAIQTMRDGMRWGYDFIHGREITLSRGDKWIKQVQYDSIKDLRRKVHAGKGEKPDIGVSVCVRRARALKIGGHDERLTYAEDNDFAIRYALPDTVTVWGYPGALVHARSETSTRWTGVTVQDDSAYMERLTSGFYVEGLKS
jgi:glycosyltransferase involved in cell wall biosynthesis